MAIIGTGISGLGCGHFLHREFELTLYEKNNYVGGHTHTISFLRQGAEVSMDTGFMVYNEVTYPFLTRLFRELGVETQPTSMSFSVQNLAHGLEFCGSGWNGLFAQRRNLLRPRFWKLLREIDRFNRQSVALLESADFEHWTLEDYMKRYQYDRDLLDWYLLPMSSAVWSTPPGNMLRFPAATLVRFFFNHGFLGLYTQHPWRTVKGGSFAYRDKLIAPFRDRIRIGCAAASIRRANGQVIVSDSLGKRLPYDHVILAAHADEALALLEDPTPLERSLLACFRYQRNTVTIHQDASVMPKERRAWSSWNSRAGLGPDGAMHYSTIYNMNSLQHLPTSEPFLISIDDPGWVRPEKVLRTMVYEHPLFSVDAVQAQESLARLNENGTTFFCGSYFRYGFHEDALVSSLDVSRRLARNFPWN